MDRAHRQELKHDKFVEQVGHTVEYAAEHRQQLVRYVIGIVVLAALGLGFYWYTKHQAGVRQDALRVAIRTQEAQVGQAQSDFVLSFATAEEKDKAVAKAWQDIIGKYSGSMEAQIAHYYLGVNSADKGNISEAEKQFKAVVDSGKAVYASQAKLALARIYESTGKTGDAEKLLRSLVSDPTILVSKEQATLLLARLLAPSKPDEARKLLEPLRTVQGPASRAAITALGELRAPGK